MNKKFRTGALLIALTGLVFAGCSQPGDQSKGGSDFAFLSLVSNTTSGTSSVIAGDQSSYVVATSDPVDTGCSISVTAPGEPGTPGSVTPGQALTFAMEGADAAHIENSGFIAGIPNWVGDLPATHTLIAPDVTTTYVFSVFTVDGVRTRNNNCEVTVNVVPPTVFTAPLPSCEIAVSPAVVAYGDPLTVTWTSQNAIAAEVSPTNAVGVLAPADVASGVWSYNSYYGNEYSMKVWNSEGVSTQCFASIKENASDNAPPAASDSFFEILAYETVSSTLNAGDLENDPLTFSIKTQPSKGTVTITDVNTGAFTYTPTPGGRGLDSFTFAANDGALESNAATVYIQYKTVVEVEAGGNHTCVLYNDGTIKCWGAGESGQLGNGGFNANELTPVAVSGIDNATQVSSGGQHTCALLDDGSIKCWGNDLHGQLGDGGAAINQSVPVVVTGITNAIQISAGGYHSCALLSGGAIKCWGLGAFGQMGNGALDGNNPLPVDVTGITNATQISVGGGHSCALLSDAGVKCWGGGGQGQMGDGNFTEKQSLPVAVSGITDAIQLTAGYDHNCVTLSDNSLKCWGFGAYGQLGDGNSVNASLPVSVSGISNAAMVSGGAYHTCVKLSDGAANCWGMGQMGQMGDGNATPTQLLPVVVSNISGAAQISAGGLHSCALFSEGNIKCWGMGNDGRLGNGVLASQLLPVDVLGLY